MKKHAMFSGSALVFCWFKDDLIADCTREKLRLNILAWSGKPLFPRSAWRQLEMWKYHNTTVGCWLFGRLSWPLAQIEIRRKHSGQTLADTIEAFKDRDKYWQPTLDQHVTGMVFPWIFLLQLHQVRQVGSCTTRLWLSMLNASKPVCHQWLHLDANGSET